MELSSRLKSIVSMIDKCNIAADIGTDHAYIPIYLIKTNICQKVIASDINKGPLLKAKNNIINEGLYDKIELRLGSGFNVLKCNEVNVAIIAGMGGNLVRDIIAHDIEVFKTLDYAILQAPQNSEVLRKYIYDMGFNIIDEELCIDGSIYYETIKVKYDIINNEVDPIYYEISEKLIQKKHPLLKEFIKYKINKYNAISKYIKCETKNAINRKNMISNKISKLEDILQCL